MWFNISKWYFCINRHVPDRWVNTHVQCGVDITQSVFSKVFSKDTHSLPVRATYGCLLCIEILMYILLQPQQWCIQYQSMFDRVIRHPPVCGPHLHYNDVTMGTIVSQITSLTSVYSIVYSDADQRKLQSSALLAFVWGIHRGPVNSPHKWPVTRKMFPFDDVIM